jgi:sugar/nucleoside kinase (ribokinase family)
VSKEIDLSCFSYLATARVLQINKYPQLNVGAEVNGVIDTLAADAPMTAIAASRLGLNVALITNPLGDDDQGKSISRNLEQNKVANSINLLPDIKTPFIVVLSDDEGNREWFSYIREAEKELIKVDLAQIDNSALVYIDLYSGIREASLRAIDYATEKGVPIFLNVSGDIPPPELIAKLKRENIAIIQIGLHESRETEAEKIAVQIYDTFDPKVSIVTLASKGAIAVSGKTVVKTQAYSVDVVHVHGAGAVFSAGFAFGYLQNWGLQQNLEFACAIGSLSCTKERGFEQFTLEKINQLIDRKNK